MSLKFLAVGQSLAGIRDGKSPYAWRKENQLPTFEAAPRFKPAEKAMVQADWLEEPRASTPAPELPPQRPFERQLPVLPPTPSQPLRPKRWFSFFGLRWFRTTRPPAELVQSELTLEKVQPVRNDLADADLRLVLKRKNKRAPGDETSSIRRGWSELTAKLFELGQR